MIEIVIIAIIYYALMTIRSLVYRKNYYSIYNPVYIYIDTKKSFRKGFMGVYTNLFFVVSCAIVTLVSKYAFHIENDIILWGVGLGAFASVWPNISTYRTYAFWNNSILFCYFVLDISVIAYSVCASGLFLGLSYWYALSLLIPIIGSMLLYYIEKFRYDDMMAATIQTKIFVAMKIIKTKTPSFNKKYGEYVSKYAKEFNLPEKLLRNMIIIEMINTGGIYSRIRKTILSLILPKSKINDYSYGIGNIKPKAVEGFYGKMPENIHKLIKCPEENIKLVAWKIRQIVDSYPGKDNHLDEETLNSSAGAIEYETLDEVGQLCRYIICKYETGYIASRYDFITINTDILLKSDAQQLLKTTKE